MKITLISILLLAALSFPAAADLAPIHVEGQNLVASGHPVRLRGINWAWWHLKGTQYNEDDMRHVSKWGCNVIRLAFTYSDLERTDHPGVWRHDGFRDIDNVLQWAKNNGVYVILDMHVVRGGQARQPYNDGGKNLFWQSQDDQDSFVALWCEIARRYRNRPEVAAYELMNEPDTEGHFDRLISIYKRTIDAIRTVDSRKVIVVDGDQMSGPKTLVDGIKLVDDNILYTFHCYIGCSNTCWWIKNAKDGKKLSGTQDWQYVDEECTVPENALQTSVMLRSSANSGTAWFDDVRVEDENGKLLQSGSFDNGPNGFQAERDPVSSMAFDPRLGHVAPGSLSVHGTADYNGWLGPRFLVEPGQKLHISAWVKTKEASGETYITAAFFGPSDGIVGTPDNRARLRSQMADAVAFSRKYGVPVWAGEFGATADQPADRHPGDFQQKWVSTLIDLFEEAGLNWSYWNFKETTSPGSMALQPEKSDGSNYPVNETLLTSLMRGWALNAKGGQ
ncbi:MAG: cellulase family glycosylhydrolase [Capsulimonadaceae bacterium]|nr:cellulase family glycosylhydrolase [Capsulimonadaceae bacterium]